MNLPPVGHSMHATNEIFNYFFLSCICSFICWFLLLFIVGFGKEQSSQLLSASDMIQYKVIWLLFFILISFHLFVATLSSFISVPSLALRLSPPDRYDYAFICIKSECIRKVSLLIGQWAIKSHIICFLVCFFFLVSNVWIALICGFGIIVQNELRMFFFRVHTMFGIVCVVFFWVNGVGLLAMNCE